MVLLRRISGQRPFEAYGIMLSLAIKSYPCGHLDRLYFED